MSWLNDIGDAAGKAFAADKLAVAAAVVGAVAVVAGIAWWLLGQGQRPGQAQVGSVDPAFGCAKCEAAKNVRLVVVEFADRLGSLAAFGGQRPQYVNLEQYGTSDPAVTSAHRKTPRPPIVVKVEPPAAVIVTLRLTRTEVNRGFPAGSAALSPREQLIPHLRWNPDLVTTVATNDQGEGKLDPGMLLPQTAGFEYHVEGSVGGKPFVRSSNSVLIKRRLAIRQVVLYPPGQAVVAAAIEQLRPVLEPLDIEFHDLPPATGPALGVRQRDDEVLGRPGLAALDETPEIMAFNPHTIGIIVGEFAPEKVETQTFEVGRLREGAQFPSSVEMSLQAGAQFWVLPLTDNSQFVSGSLSYDKPAGSIDLQASDVSDLSKFAGRVTVSLARMLSSIPATATKIVVSVKLKVMSAWAIGWAYGEGAPLIYLNMRDPLTNSLLDADAAVALVLHELGHKLRLTSAGRNYAPDPDQQPGHYVRGKNGINHFGNHCASGIPAQMSLVDPRADESSNCVMWGKLMGRRSFCPECKITLRKVDLGGGYFRLDA